MAQGLVSADTDHSMQSVVVPEEDALLDPTPVKHYPYTRTFDEARRDPLVVLHTSGTTGMFILCVKIHAVLSVQWF